MSPPMLPSVKLSAIHGSNRQHARLHLRMIGQEGVEAGGPGVHQRFSHGELAA
jgi:hypothetical protein